MSAETVPTMLLSRVAEHLYWAGRYLERAEATARQVRTHTELFVDLPRSAALGWSPLLAVTGSQESFADGYDHVHEEGVVAWLLAEPANHGSVVTSFAQARENLRVTRGIIPLRMWEVVNETHRWASGSAASGCARGARSLWTEEVIRRCLMVAGVTTSVMTRDLVYAFTQIGRLLERADMTSRVLDVQAGLLMGADAEKIEPFTDLTWMAMLRSLDGEEMYRRRTGAVVSPSAAVRFVLHDPTFPRSVEYCLLEIARYLSVLPHHAEPVAAATAAHRLLEGVDLDEIDLDAIHRFVDDLQLGLQAVHDRLAACYLPVLDAGDLRP